MRISIHKTFREGHKSSRLTNPFARAILEKTEIRGGERMEKRKTGSIPYEIIGDISVYVQDFYNASGIHVGIHDVDKTILVDPKTTVPNLCSFCCDRCEEFKKQCGCYDEAHIAEVEQTKRAIVYKCHIGLTEAIVPVVEDASLLGVIFLGQIRIEEDPETEFEALYRRLSERYPNVFTDRARGEARGAYDRTTAMTKERFAAFLSLAEIGARGIYADRWLRFRVTSPESSFRRLMKATDFAHIPLADFSVEKIAHQLNISYSHLNRITVSVCGMPLKRYLLETKIKTAAELKRNRPGIPVAQAASIVGIENPHYFSRLFRKLMGYSFTEYGQKESGN